MILRGGSAPLYWRVLRLRRLRPRPAVTFLLFEGSIALAVLLSLAEVIDWWSAFMIPVSVALMVKLNDLIAANFDLRRLAEAQLRTPRPKDGRRIGISPVPLGARMSDRIDLDDAAAGPAAPPSGAAVGVASVPIGSVPPQPVAPDPEEPPADEPSETHPETHGRHRGNQGRFEL